MKKKKKKKKATKGTIILGPVLDGANSVTKVTERSLIYSYLSLSHKNKLTSDN